MNRQAFLYNSILLGFGNLLSLYVHTPIGSTPLTSTGRYQQVFLALGLGAVMMMLAASQSCFQPARRAAQPGEPGATADGDYAPRTRVIERAQAAPQKAGP